MMPGRKRLKGYRMGKSKWSHFSKVENHALDFFIDSNIRNPITF